MIYRLDNNQEDCSNKVKPNTNSPAYLRINGLFKAYGTKYKFIDFYTNLSNNLFFCVKENFADIYIGENFDMAEYEELKEFLYLKCNEIQTEIPLNSINSIDLLTIATGNIYTSPISDRVSFIDNKNINLSISNEIKDCYNVVKDVFFNQISEEYYQIWYTDLSHRVRHGMTITYTITDGDNLISTAMAYAFENETVLISYLTTREKYRDKGYAKYLLNHIAKELNATKLIFQSQDELSDNFYEKLGLIKYGEYYNYKLM